ncbi:MAG: hypothetical protein CL912_08790 [Deltaproteobacteria bacterium]|nr:hypothetical protein [Deltaproteobacteria bacterium]
MHTTYHNLRSRPMPSLKRIATSDFISGGILDTPSQCGVNCSYKINFEGPYILCDPLKSSNVSRAFSKEQYLVKQAGVNIMFSANHDRVASLDSYYTQSQLNIYISRIIGFWPIRPPDADSGDDNFIWETHNLTCRPHRADYMEKWCTRGHTHRRSP